MAIDDTKNPNTLAIPSDMQNISKVEPLITEAFESHRINFNHFGNVLVALTEATNNAIMHGNKCHPEKNVFISYSYKAPMLYFSVKDQGVGFDFSHLPDPTDPENLEKPNGRGVFLMKRLADQIEFEDNGSMVKLGFRIEE
jgi:serine/threonine-protein kinase RsbW